jgi:hypothetical protein
MIFIVVTLFYFYDDHFSEAGILHITMFLAGGISW